MNSLDVLIVGGGPAGLTAALYLGRGRKTVEVIDGGDPRHAVSAGVHNFLTREGMAPAALRETAWAQMAPYTSVRQRSAVVESLIRRDGLWQARTLDGVTRQARAVLLATGVIDEHPDVPGYRERWGHAIHHCPYCHGWEMRDRPVAVMGHGEALAHLPPLLRGWTEDVIVLTQGGEVPDDTRHQLGELGIPIYEAPVRELVGPGRELAEIRLADGTTLARQGLFVIAPQHQVPLVKELGLELDDLGYVKIDHTGATSAPMVWAAGDLTSRMQQVVEAAAQGARAGAMINASLTLAQ